MARKLLFTELDELFASGKDFEISDARYKEITGRDLPKGSSYLRNRSALANKARKNGYSITVKEEPVIVKKVFFKKG